MREPCAASRVGSGAPEVTWLLTMAVVAAVPLAGALEVCPAAPTVTLRPVDANTPYKDRSQHVLVSATNTTITYSLQMSGCDEVWSSFVITRVPRPVWRLQEARPGERVWYEVSYHIAGGRWVQVSLTHNALPFTHHRHPANCTAHHARLSFANDTLVGSYCPPAHALEKDASVVYVIAGVVAVIVLFIVVDVVCFFRYKSKQRLKAAKDDHSAPQEDAKDAPVPVPRTTPSPSPLTKPRPPPTPSQQDLDTDASYEVMSELVFKEVPPPRVSREGERKEERKTGKKVEKKTGRKEEERKTGKKNMEEERKKAGRSWVLDWGVGGPDGEKIERKGEKNDNKDDRKEERRTERKEERRTERMEERRTERKDERRTERKTEGRGWITSFHRSLTSQNSLEPLIEKE